MNANVCRPIHPNLIPRDVLWARNMGYGPLFCRWFIKGLSWACYDSELGAMLGDHRIFFGLMVRVVRPSFFVWRYLAGDEITTRIRT